jgi:hypothetical protein
MSDEDALKLLRAKCDELGQATVAKAIGKSAAAVNQVYHGTYKGVPGNILAKVVELFGSITLPCPFLGYEISLRECAENKSRPFGGATNSYLVRFFRACRACGGKS